ncbi:hypothetical protein F0562_003720 [Nyssa sinensis]|uniref:Ubiquitin-conjugating enzyme E2C-binding protein n=1 Tax=Nyssa sinensis TaxID=561372 RepID=A0A5J5BXQ2_9ASTE|nr:hypothetical protein F0562_003720 [Nyssa sinensis]
MSSELRTSENPRKWRFTWEAQSHIPTLRLLIFNPNTRPSTQCENLKINLVPEQSLLVASWFEEEVEISLRVLVPRVLIDVESPVNFRALDDYIEVKLVLLLPVDHPILTNFEEESHPETAFFDDLLPLSMDSELKSLSSAGGVHFYCRNCSAKLTRSLRFFVDMPSVNWREVADNWFGACCCSFGGISEKLVTRYANSYTCAVGVCLLNTTSVILSKDDLEGCNFPDCNGSPQKYELKADFTGDNCLTKAMVDNGNDHGRACCENQIPGIHGSNVKLSCIRPRKDYLLANLECEVSEKLNNANNLSCMFPALEIFEGVASAPGCCSNMTSQVVNHIEDCSLDTSETSLKEQNLTTIELLENQKSFLNGFLGNVFMARSSNVSKDVQWIEFSCHQCSCLLGAYPCGNGQAPLDGGIRLFKCHISTCLPVGGFNDLFRKYTLERMFANQLLESAKDELSFRTVVRDLETRSPVLQIVILNPNSWCCTGYCVDTDAAMEPIAKIELYPVIKVLFSDCRSSTESQLRSVEEWVTQNQADEVYMLAHQVKELIESLESSKFILPPSYTVLQGLSLSSIRR